MRSPMAGKIARSGCRWYSPHSTTRAGVARRIRVRKEPAMEYIDAHIHMISRITDDYQRMAQCGCVAVSEPAFWAGFDRGSAVAFHDYFRQLTEYEPRRAAQFHVKHYC